MKLTPVLVTDTSRDLEFSGTIEGQDSKSKNSVVCSLTYEFEKNGNEQRCFALFDVQSLLTFRQGFRRSTIDRISRRFFPFFISVATVLKSWSIILELVLVKVSSITLSRKV
jgi:hypothetical protein